MGYEGLEVEEDERFRRRETVVERVGWAVMTLVIIAALLGAFGRGPLSSAQVTGPRDTVTVEYQRFARYSAPADLWITTDAAAVRGGRVELTLSPDWADGADIERVVPEPDSWSSGPDGLRLTFTAEPAPLDVRISYRPGTVGRRTGTVTVGNDGPRVGFRQFVYF